MKKKKLKQTNASAHIQYKFKIREGSPVYWNQVKKSPISAWMENTVS